MNKQLLRGLCGMMLLASIASCATEDGEVATDEATSAITFSGPVVYDAGSTCTVGGVRMHCCPSGTAMIGAHVNNNVFKCAQVTSMLDSPFLDSGSVRNGMHACPFGSVMVGLHVGRNLLACQTPAPGNISFEFVDGNPATTDGFPMHICQSGFAMAGIHVNNNLFTCDR